MEQEKKLEDAAKYYAATYLQVQAISKKIDYAAAECRPYVCDTCNKGFPSNAKLVAHIRVHTGEKPYHCSYCPRAFAMLGNLNQHEKMHRGERDYKCPFCPKTFVTPTEMNKHIRTHAGLKLYQCPDCPQKYYTAGNLKNHRIRKHELERPQTCTQDKCDTKFIDRRDLNSHLKSVHGILLPYECSKCDQRFRLHNELLCHEPIHENSDAVVKQPKSIQPSSFLQKPVNKSLPVDENQNSMEKSSTKSGGDLESNTKISKDTVSSKKVQDRFLNEKRNVVKVSPKNQVIFSKSGKTEKTRKQDEEEIVVIYQGNEKKEEATKECSDNNKFEKLSPKTQIGKKCQITEKLQKPDEKEIVVIYQANQKEEVSKECSINSDLKTKKTKIVSQDAENETTQNKVKQSNENFQNSETKKKNEKQKIIDIEKHTNQMKVDKTKGSIKLKRQKKTKKCEFTFRERIDGLQNKYEEQIVVLYQGTPQKETVKECSANNKIDNKKQKEKRKVSENIENEAPGNTEIQLIDISDESSDHSNPKKKKNNKEEIIDVENQNIITIEDDENENEQSLKKIKKYECSCGKCFSSTSIFKRHRKRRGHHRPRIHVCPFCEDESFKTIRKFELHFNEMHCDNSEEEEEEEVEESSVYDSDEDGPLIHECFLCLPKFRAFPDIDALERHYNRIHKSLT